MDIYSILASKPHNTHYLNRYINFINQCQLKNLGYKGPIEKHHICPKANDMFPEYKCFNKNPWNKVELTPRQHFISHLLLWKSFPDIESCIDAIWGMKCRRQIFVNSRLYEQMQIQASKITSRRSKGMIVARDKSGSTHRVSVSDERFETGELEYIATGTKVVKDYSGNIFVVQVDDPRRKTGELVSVNKDMCVAVDSNGFTQYVSVNDPRFISGDIKHISKGMANVIDSEGNKFKVSVDDPRYISGELQHANKGFVTVFDKNGKKTQSFH